MSYVGEAVAIVVADSRYHAEDAAARVTVDYELLPARIEELDRAIARDEEAMSDPDLYTRDPKRFAALTQSIERARAEKDEAELRWLSLAELVEG